LGRRVVAFTTLKPGDSVGGPLRIGGIGHCQVGVPGLLNAGGLNDRSSLPPGSARNTIGCGFANAEFKALRLEP